jgi:hypothetical protein
VRDKEKPEKFFCLLFGVGNLEICDGEKVGRGESVLKFGL